MNTRGAVHSRRAGLLPGFFSALLLGLALAWLPLSAVADLRLPALLGDGAVLQRDAEARLWGWADDGESVRVFLDGQLVDTARAADGRWALALPPQPAGGPHKLRFKGRNSVTVEDVWFGDVWIASGQSNMELTMARVAERYAAEVAAADLPQVRQFKVPKDYDFQAPRADVDAAWVASTPETVLEFSAVAWLFARDLHARYGVPVGIVNASYGGSPAEGWMSAEVLEGWPHYLEVARKLSDDAYLESIKEADRAANEAWYGALAAADRGLQAAPGWAAPEADDAGWATMDLPGYWAESGLGPVNGAVWFRRTVELPGSAAGQPGLLRLGRIVDADTAWVNGRQVGNTTYQYPPRRYRVPEGVLRAGANTIAVRVVNSAGQGGFVPDKPYALEVGGQSFDLSGPWRYRLGAEEPPLGAPYFMDWRQPLGFYNAMLAPLQNLTIKGVIWYQGESNVDRAEEYRRLFPAMIRAWRAQWGQGEFPFLYVQLANFLEAHEQPLESEWAEARNAQLLTLEVPNTAMAVAIDAGEWNDIHPENKQVIGERLALAARALAYGEEDLVYSGPVVDSVTAADGRLLLSFAHAGSGLDARGGPLRGFAVAGADGAFAWAEAEILGNDRIAVRSEAVPRPLLVRYAWADNPADANLYNREGLPSSPFEARVPAGGAPLTPEAVGAGLVRDLLGREDFMWYESAGYSGLHYAEINTAFGALRFLARTDDRDTLQQVLARYNDVPAIDVLAAAHHVDASVYGILPLQAWLLTRQQPFLDTGLRFADGQWVEPRPDGLSRETRFWIDDVWMVNSLQVQAFRAAGNPVYLDRAALQTEAYLERLQQPNGLFHHGEGSPFFWGRGNGWVAAGLAELLSELPADHPRYPVIVDGYRRMMEALLRYQAPDGMWRQLVDDPGAWAESSGTAMFGYAMAVGVRLGILSDDPYRDVYRRAWSALAQRLDEHGRLTEICVGTGKGTSQPYYLDRPRETGDFHGHAPLLWFAFELLDE